MSTLLKYALPHFLSLQDDVLAKKEWFVQSKDSFWWNRRNDRPPFLTLYTLQGDSWPDSVHAPQIKNLLIRKIDWDCFAAEIRLDSFMPGANWQQAGILLMEDTLFKGNSVRLSIAYNDFFDGFSRPKEIIIQGIRSGGENFSKPEEIAHIPLFTIENGQDSLVSKNMRYAALRIEKNGNHFRFLYSASPVENFALKEAFSKDLPVHPKYIGVFALQGFVSNTNYIPVHIGFFNLSGLPCEK